MSGAILGQDAGLSQSRKPDGFTCLTPALSRKSRDYVGGKKKKILGCWWSATLTTNTPNPDFVKSVG